jgi:hypothetical protein
MASSMCVGIEAHVYAKPEPDICPARFNVSITHGRTGWMDDFSARRTWTMCRGLIRLIIPCMQ